MRVKTTVEQGEITSSEALELRQLIHAGSGVIDYIMFTDGVGNAYWFAFDLGICSEQRKL
jgi:hypothetical protein